MRPENFTINTEKTNGEEFIANVYVTEPLGEDMIVDVTVADAKLKLKTSVDLEITMGDKIWLGVQKKKMHLFDRKTESSYF